MNGVIYARYSDGPRQTDQSIEGQLRDCYAYAKRNDIQIVDTYIDRHISGTHFENRQELQRLMQDATKRQFSTVLVWKQDRFGRDRYEIIMHKVALQKCGVKLVSVMEFIPDGPEGILMEAMLEGIAEYYSADLRQKIQRGIRESAHKGYVLGGNPCFGFVRKERRYVLDPAAAAIVREVFSRYAAGETAKQLRNDLNRRGILNSCGRPWSLNSIYYMLRNEKYVGIYRYEDIVRDDVIPRIVPQDLWDKVQNIAGRNTSKYRESVVNDFLLSGKLICGECGHTFIGESGTGRHGEKHYYYKCRGKKQHLSDCKMRTFRKDDLENMVIRATLEFVLTPDNIEMLVDDFMRLQEEDVHSAYLQTMTKRRKDIEKGIRNIMNAIEAGIITDTTKERLMELEEQKSVLDIDIAKEEMKKPDISRERLLFFFQRLLAGSISDSAYCVSLINTFVNTVYLYPDHMLIVYNFCDGDPDRRKIKMEIDKQKKSGISLPHKEGSTNPGNVGATVTQSNPLQFIFLVQPSYFVFYMNYEVFAR